MFIHAEKTYAILCWIFEPSFQFLSYIIYKLLHMPSYMPQCLLVAHLVQLLQFWPHPSSSLRFLRFFTRVAWGRSPGRTDILQSCKQLLRRLLFLIFRHLIFFYYDLDFSSFISYFSLLFSVIIASFHFPFVVLLLLLSCCVLWCPRQSR